MKARLRFRRESAQPHGDAAGPLLRALTFAFVAAMIALAVHQSCQDNPEQVDVPPASVAVDPLASELCPLPHHHVGAERIRRHLPPRLGGKPAPVFRAVVPTPERRGE